MSSSKRPRFSLQISISVSPSMKKDCYGQVSGQKELRIEKIGVNNLFPKFTFN